MRVISSRLCTDTTPNKDISMSKLTFLVEGFDGDTPLQAYCSVKTPDFMIVDSIYPHPNISICVGNIDSGNQFGDNAYTRRTTIKELIELGRIIHGVKHFYHCYKAVLKTYNEIEAMEFDRFDHHQFASEEERSQAVMQMHQRLKQIYIHYLQRAIPEVSISDHPDMVIRPYLLAQILKQIK